MSYTAEEEDRNSDLNKGPSMEELCRKAGFDPEDPDEWRTFINEWYSSDGG